MQDFYRVSSPMPLDQADGLRRLFAGQASQRQVLVPLVANPHVAFSGVLLDHVAHALGHGLGRARKVLVVDAGASSPQPPEMAALDLAACIEPVNAQLAYLPARGLPKAHVDTRGSAAGFIDTLQRAAPQAEVILLHAEASDHARIFKRRAARPVLLGADHPESIKHAYAGAKLLAQRCNLMSFDLLLAAAMQSPRVGAIAHSLSGCLDSFLGACLVHSAVVDPAADLHAGAGTALATLLTAQLSLDPHGDPAHAYLRAQPAPAARTAF